MNRDLNIDLGSMDIYEAVSAGLDVAETRSDLVEHFAGVYPGASEEDRTYFANLAIGALFAHPGSTQEQAIERAVEMLTADVQRGDEKAASMHKAIVKTLYRPVYDKVTDPDVNLDPVPALRKKFGLDLKTARAAVALIEGIIKEEKEAAQSGASVSELNAEADGEEQEIAA